MVDEAGNQLFTVAQQLQFGYEIHAFEDKEQFEAWAKANPMPGLCKPADARGRPVNRRPIDHRFDQGE